jgi:hypothetical protein
VCLFLSPERFNDWTNVLLAFQGSRRCPPITVPKPEPVVEQKPVEQPIEAEPLDNKDSRELPSIDCSTLSTRDLSPFQIPSAATSAPSTPKPRRATTA